MSSPALGPAQLGEPEHGEAPAAVAAPASAAATAAQQAADEELPRRDSEELNPVSLADLFAKDPECAAGKNKEKPVSRSHLFAGAQLDDELELKKLQVFVRIRPSVTAGAPRWDAENCIHATSKYSIAIAPPEGSQAYKSGDRGQTYSFSRVFDADTQQQEYFEATAAPLVRDLLRNKQHNSVMMAYGITAAGKTYTIEGTKEQPGVMPRALLMLFEGLSNHVEPIVARASYYEVYNEQIYDLLDEHGIGPLGQRAALKLKEDTLGRVFVAGLSEVEVGSAEDALAVLRKGSRQRQRAETGLNYNSSRSHSIFTVTLYQQGLDAQPSEDASSGDEGEEQAGSSEEKLGRISFVDLAGSERAQRTGNVGVRLKESVAINSSLMTLGRCLEALRWNQQHKAGGNLRVVPYRESKVTHLFRDALHGWGQVILSVNVSPASKDYDETAHVLKYAALATQIGTIQQAEAPRRTIKAVSPAIKKVKRKAALPPEARGQGGKTKKVKKAAAAPGGAAATEGQQAALPAVAEVADEEAGAEAEGSLAAHGSEPENDTAGAAADSSSEQQDQEDVCDGGEAAELEGGAAADDDGVGCEEAQPDGFLGDREEEDAELAGEFGTPVTPLAGGDDATAALQAQVQQLIADLQKAEERCVLLEAEVREEVADEMAQLLRDMEESYRQRLEAEVEALEKKAASAAADAGRRGRGRGGGAAAAAAATNAAHSEAIAELAVAREEAAQATAEAEQLRERAAELEAELQEAKQKLAEAQSQAEQQQADAAAQAADLQGQAAAAQEACSKAQELLQAEQQRAAELEAELACMRQQATGAQASAEAERQRAEGLAAELAAARQETQAAQAASDAAQQQMAQLQTDLAAAQQQAAAMQAELAAVQELAAGLEAELAATREAASSDQQQVSEQYEAQLQEAVTQLEANKSMELEMAEEQAERLRRENLALQQRLHAALAALATYGSPLAGPGGLAARMAQVAPEGNGRGAGGTPHDVALARARLAAAADEAAAAAAAPPAAATAGGSVMPRSRSRFAEEAGAPGGALDPVPEEPAVTAAGCAPADAAAGVAAQAEEDKQQETKPNPRPRGRPRKAVAFAVEEVPAEAAVPSAQQPQQAAAIEAGAAAAESKRSRRMTRAAAAAVPAAVLQAVVEEQPAAAAQPQQLELPQPAEAAPQQQPKPRRGRRRTEAVAVTAPAPVPEAAPADPEQEAAPAERQSCRGQPVPGVVAPEVAVPAGSSMHDEADVPLMASVNFEQAPAQAAGAAVQPDEAGAAAASKAAQPPRRRGRPAANKENNGGDQAAGAKLASAAPLAPNLEADTSKPQNEAAGSAHEPARKGQRRKRLLPSQPMSAEMRSALGDPEDLSLTSLARKRQAKAAASAASGSDPAAEAGGKRSRRQTQFFRL